MTKSDLKVGYTVQTRGGHFGIIVPFGSEGSSLAIAYEDPDYRGGWDPVADYMDSLKYYDDRTCENDIVKVFGYHKFGTKLLKMKESFISCEPLWVRKDPKKMTVAEVCEALGYDVEIVKEG